MLTLVAYLITDNVMAVAYKMQRELKYSTKVKACSMTCDTANHPSVVSTLYNDISYKLYIVKSANQLPMHGRYFHTFSDAFNWATGSQKPFESYSWSGPVPDYTHTTDVIARWVPEIKRVEQNFKKGDIYTTVIWEDGSKPTVVKAAKDELPSMYFAVASAIAIKVYGSNSAFKRKIKNLTGMSF